MRCLRYHVRRRAIALASLAVALSSAGACSSGVGTLASGTASAAGFPRSVDIDGRRVTIPARPVRIAVLSPGIGEAAYKLVDSSRIAAVSATLDDERLTNVAALVRRTPIRLPAGFKMDPEQVLALKPDLVLVEPSHDAERDAERILAAAGIPVVSMGRWQTVADIAHNIETLGAVLGAENQAARITHRMNARVADVERTVADAVERPVVLALSGFANPLMPGPGTVTHNIIALAGGMNATDLMRAGPWDAADVERIVAADPDYIVLIDLRGTGLGGFRSLLEHPGMQAVTAVRFGRIKVLAPRITISVGTDQVVDGLEEIARWIHSQRFATTAGRASS